MRKQTSFTLAAIALSLMLGNPHHEARAQTPPPARLAQSVTIAPPPVKIEGTLVSPKANYAILRSTNQTYIVAQGKKLGDYTVVKIEPGKVEFGYKTARFLLKEEFAIGVNKNAPDPAPTEPGKALPATPQFRLNLVNADLVYALKLVAKISNAGVVIAPGTDGSVTLSGAFDANSALRGVLEGQSFDYTVQDNCLIVAPAARLTDILTKWRANRAAMTPDTNKLVSLDFVNADMAYVMEVLSKEMMVNNTAPLPDGSVTCTVQSWPIPKLWALLCAVQDPAVGISATGTSIHYDFPAPKH